MKNLTPFDDNDEFFHQIVSAKAYVIKKPIEDKLQSILDFYGLYRHNRHFLERLKRDKTITNELKACLLACYNSPTLKLEELKQQIKNANGDYAYCPYCGINTSDSFDHYLPKSVFPQYCVFPLNLIPACSQCNRIKGERCLKDGKRVFINPYFDDFLKRKFLSVRLDFESNVDNVPTVEFALIESALSKEEKITATSHLKVLNLYERFLKVASQEVSGIHRQYKLVNAIQPLPIAQIRLLLLKEAQSLGEIRGVNNYFAALCQALGESEEFLKLCTQA